MKSFGHAAWSFRIVRFPQKSDARDHSQGNLSFSIDNVISEFHLIKIGIRELWSRGKLRRR